MANPPITVGELANVPAPLSPITSPWAQDVSHRVTHRFGSTGARDAAYPAAAAGVGAICAVGPVLYTSDGTKWVGMAAERHAAKLLVNNQAISAGAVAALAWQSKTFDTDGYATGSSPWAGFTVPAGLDGVYALWLNVWVSTPGALCDIVLTASAEPVPIGYGYLPTAKSQITVTATDNLTAGQAIIAQIYNANTAAWPFSAQLLIARLSL